MNDIKRYVKNQLPSTYFIGKKVSKNMPETLEIYVWRFARLEEYTIGRLYINGRYVCDTLEDKDYGFDGTTDKTLIRQTKKEHPSAVAIPYGRYQVDTNWARGFANTHKWYLTAPLGARIPCLVGIPCYSGVLIHRGTNKDHTSGCILVGYNRIKGGLVNTDIAYIKVAQAIQEANTKDMETYITISPNKPDFLQ